MWAFANSLDCTFSSRGTAFSFIVDTVIDLIRHLCLGLDMRHSPSCCVGKVHWAPHQASPLLLAWCFDKMFLNSPQLRYGRFKRAHLCVPSKARERLLLFSSNFKMFLPLAAVGLGQVALASLAA